MNCWKSYSAELTMRTILFEKDEKVKSNKWDELHKKQKDAQNKGQVLLLNDSIILDIINNDSLYTFLKEERNTIADSLIQYKSKVPFFKKQIEKISNSIVEYNYYSNNSWGIYEMPFKEDVLFTLEKFYLNYSELLKEGYSLPENGDVSEIDILSVNKILNSLEELDRQLWVVKHFNVTKDKIQKEDLEHKRKQQVDSLFNN